METDMLTRIVIALLVGTLVSCQRTETVDPDRNGPTTPSGVREPAIDEPVSPSNDSDFMPATIGGRTVRLEVADSPATRGRGLGGRASLPADTGMIFLYPDSETRSFWMDGCLMGLDIAFLDAKERIFQIASLAPPPETPGRIEDVTSTAGARTVVEMELGWFEAAGISTLR